MLGLLPELILIAVSIIAGTKSWLEFCGMAFGGVLNNMSLLRYRVPRLLVLCFASLHSSSYVTVRCHCLNDAGGAFHIQRQSTPHKFQAHQS